MELEWFDIHGVFLLHLEAGDNGWSIKKLCFPGGWDPTAAVPHLIKKKKPQNLNFCLSCVILKKKRREMCWLSRNQPGFGRNWSCGKGEWGKTGCKTHLNYQGNALRGLFFCWLSTLGVLWSSHFPSLPASHKSSWVRKLISRHSCAPGFWNLGNLRVGGGEKRE